MEAYLPLGYGFFLVLFRTAGLIAVAPPFNMRTIPARVRLGVSVGITVVIFIAAGSPRVELPPTLFHLAGAAMAETAIGLIGGLGAQVVLNAALGAGHLISVNMGFSMAQQVDPINGLESTVLQQLLLFMTLAMAVSFGIHREAIIWLTRSIHTFPPGASVDLIPFFTRLMSHCLYAVALSVRLAAPVLGAVTMGNVALGLLSRAVPSLSLQSIGFSIGILAGGGALYMVAPTIAEMAARASVATFAN